MTLMTYSLTITATIAPPLTEEQASAVGEELAARTAGRLALTSHGVDDQDGWASWTVAVGDTSGGPAAQLATLEVALHTAVAAAHRITLAGLEAITSTEVSRRLALYGAPKPGEGATPGRPLPHIPETVSTAEFAKLLDLTPARVRQLRQSRRPVGSPAGVLVPFPVEVAPGHYPREAVEAYVAATLQRRQG